MDEILSFASQMTYTVTITAADDLAGNPLAGALIIWHFTTVPSIIAPSYQMYLPLVLRSY